MLGNRLRHAAAAPRGWCCFRSSASSSYLALLWTPLATYAWGYKKIHYMHHEFSTPSRQRQLRPPAETIILGFARSCPSFSSAPFIHLDRLDPRAASCRPSACTAATISLQPGSLHPLCRRRALARPAPHQVRKNYAPMFTYLDRLSARRHPPAQSRWRVRRRAGTVAAGPGKKSQLRLALLVL